MALQLTIIVDYRNGNAQVNQDEFNAYFSNINSQRENRRMQKNIKQLNQLVYEMTLDDLLKYPELQKRISSKQFQISAIHSMITSLKGETIDKLKKEFVSCSNCVNLQQFVWLMSHCLQLQQFQISKPDFQETFTTVFNQKQSTFTMNELKKYELEYELIKIFEDIDIDESASITWEQFIEYITCISLTQIQNTGDDTQRQNAATFKNQENSMKEVEFTHIQKALFRKNSIGKIVQLQRHGKLAIVEKKSGNLSFININGSLQGKPLQLANVDYSKVLSIDYSEDDRLFGLLMNNHRVVFIEDGQMQKNHGENKFSGDQIEIMYLRIHKLWLLVCMDQSIHIFKPPKGRSQTTNSHKLLLSFIPHSLPKSHFLKNNKGGANIIGIKESMNPFGLYTGSINGEIKIWSLEKNELLIKLYPCEQEITDNRQNSLKGFQVFNQKSVSYMISWIFTNQISVWLPSSSLAKAYLGKLRGHMGIVQDAKFLHNFPHVISIDNKASVRVWNIRKFQCIQNWRLDHPNQIFILKTIPFALFFDRLISFYKIKCEEEYQIVQKKMGLKTIVAPTQKNHQNNPIKDKSEGLNKVDRKIKRVTFENEENSEVQAQNCFTHIYDIDKKDYIKEKESIQIEAQIGQESSTVIQVLYDDYYDCFLILSEEQVKEVSVNNGKVLNKIEPKQKNEVFLAMCLKKHRRVFIANNIGQISLFRVEDGAKLFTLNVLNENMNLEFRKHNGILNQELQIYSIDYNIHNQVLLSVGSWHSEPLLTAYSPDLSRKKQIFFDQNNICSFCSAANYNIFYIASNSPQIITIWDYHNIIPLKAIELQNPIKSISCEAHIQNILIVTQDRGIRLFRFNGVQPRNTATLFKESNNFLRSEIYLSGEDYDEKLIRSELVSYRKKIKNRKVRVAFADGTSEELNNKRNHSKVQQVIGLYVQTVNKLIFIDLTNHLSLNQSTPPKKSNSPNIIKQEKFYDIIPVKEETLSHSKRTIPYQSLITQSITNIKQKLCKIGYTRQMIYFSMVGMDTKASNQSTGVINFYDYKDSVVRGKLSLPGGQLIFWNICITLSHKIFEKMLRAEKIAYDVHSKLLVRNDGYFEKIENLRKAFLVKRYLTDDDIKSIMQYIAKNQKSYSNISQYQEFQSNSTFERNVKSSNILAEAIEEYQKKQERKKLLGQNSIKKSIHQTNAQVYTEQTHQSGHNIKKMRSQSFNRLKPGLVDAHKQKRKEIEEKYSEVFKYLNKKKNNKEQVQKDRKEEESKGSAQSNFKIKMMSTAKSAQKMHRYQTKIANEFRNKIEILEWNLSNVESNPRKTRLKL